MSLNTQIPEPFLTALRWYHAGKDQAVVGLIALVYPELGYWKLYIGVGQGLDSIKDMEHIAAWGTKVDKELALFLSKNRWADLTYEE